MTTPDKPTYQDKCGSVSYRDDPMCRWWPRGACDLSRGHESQHQFAIPPGDVFFVWDHTAQEVESVAR